MTSGSVDHTGSGGADRDWDPRPAGSGIHEYVSAIHTKGEGEGQVPNYR